MTGLPLFAALVWILALVVDAGPFGSIGALLVGVGLVTIAAVSVVGMTLTGGRWARRLALVSVGAGLIIAVIRSIDGFWIAATVSSIVAGSVLFLPGLTSRIRKLPAAAGPPQTAVLLSLGLLAVPFVLGAVARNDADWPELAIGLTAPLFAFFFARVIPGGLLGVRVIWPAFALGATPLVTTPVNWVTAFISIAIAGLAWRPEIKASFHPPRETGTRYPIPPELAPREILDAAKLDDKGRPK